MRMLVSNIRTCIIQDCSSLVATNITNAVDAIAATKTLLVAINQQLDVHGISMDLVFVNEYDREYNPDKELGYWIVRTDKKGESDAVSKTTVTK
jgi:hypothetical protein